MDLSEQTFEVNGLAFKALRWRREAASDRSAKVICLHGWLDNAASFLALAPRLNVAEIVAFDLAGHGQSSHRSQDASYNVWEDLEDVLGVAECLGWSEFSLMGHSRGGTIAVQLAAVMPELVEKLILIDSLFLYNNSHPYVEQLRKYIEDRKRYSRRRKNIFSDTEKALDQRLNFGATALKAGEARKLVERNLRAVDTGFVWSYDDRLRGASAIKLVEPFVESIMESLQSPTLMIAATNGSYSFAEMKPQLEQIRNHAAIDVVVHEGGHHLHMEQEQVLSLSEQINNWMAEPGSIK